MNSLHRFAAGLAASGLLLAASSVSAEGGHMDGHEGNHRNGTGSGIHTNVRGEGKGEMHNNDDHHGPRVGSGSTVKHDDDHRSGTGSAMDRDNRHEEKEGKHMTGSGSRTGGDSNHGKGDKKATRLEMIKRSIGSFAEMSKKLCASASTDAATVSACIQTAKTNLKASVNAMIDAAFGQ